MTRNATVEITQLLRSSSSGDTAATARLLEMMYDALHGQAVRIFSGERVGHTLQPTALVHESFLRLVGLREIEWQSRRHFLTVAAGMMRRILTDHARTQKRLKRGGAWTKIADLDERQLSLSSDDDVLSVHESLEKLEQVDPRQAQIVELRFFGGLSHAEVAETLGISLRRVEAEWAFAKAWLRKELSV
jgi:RNA polymerase sigma factor (TIGR02999 family)